MIALEIIKAACGVGVVLIGFWGLQTWRRQLYGTAHYETARRLYRAVLEVRERMSEVRASFIPPGEFDTAFREAGIEPRGGVAINDSRADYLVYNRRWSGLAKALVALRTECLEAEVLWGGDFTKHEQELRTLAGQLHSAIRNHVRQRDDRSEYSEKLEALRERQFDTLYEEEPSESPNAFSQKVNAAVKSFETLLRPHLNAKRSRTAK